MRPVKLIMQAFGPYAGTQELNMDELGETGIYAITGETGAGKTTIFDAIVYALYGVGSGQDRADGKSLRAVGANPDVETKVELDFVSNGKKYHVERRPRQSLIGKRKGEPVEKPAAQLLVMPDGTRYTGDKVIAEKIEKDILGVTKDQFCQIVMIAQGEFRKLLRADTKERKLIFRKIFKTDPYASLEEAFQKRCKAKYEEYIDSRREVVNALKNLDVEAGNPLSEELDRLKQSKPTDLYVEEAAELVEQLVALDEAAYAVAAKALKHAEDERDAARKALEKANQQVADQQKLERLRAGLEDQQKQLADAEAARVNAEAQRPEIERLSAEITTENNWLPKYAELDDKAAAQERLKKDLRAAEAARDAAQKKADDLQAKQAALTDEAEGLKGAHDRRQSFSEKLNDAKAAGDRLRALDDRVKARDDAVTALKNAKAAEEQAAKDEQAAADVLKKYTEELEALGNTELTVSTLEGVKKSLADRAKKLEEEQALYDKYVKAVKSSAAAQSVYLQKQSLAEQKRGEAGQLRQRYNANIAGILASDLAEGTPCPVCGSVHHPNPAALSADAVTAEAVDKAEEAAANAEKEASKQASVCAAENEKRDGYKAQLVERMPDVLEADWPADIQRRQTENADAQRENAGQLKAAKDAHDRKQRLQKTELPKAQKAKEDAANKVKQAGKALSEAETNHKNAEAEVANAAAIMPAGWTPLDLSDALSENGRQQRDLQRKMEQAERDIDRLTEIGNQQEQNRKSIEAQKETVNNQGLKIAELETSIKNGQQSIDALKAELPYPAKADCERALRQKSAQKKALEDAIKAAQDAENRLHQAIANTKGQIKPLEDALKDAPPADTAAAEATYKEAQAVHAQAAKLEKDVGKRRDINKGQQAKLSTESAEARRLEAEYRMMKDVSDTVNGDVTGKPRVTLETSVQAAYFDRIIDYANTRLIHMSRQQFALVRRNTEDAEKRSQTGLDLDIRDYANGTNRAVGTLSGGEAFLAALSLALGMSDAIQGKTAVQLDAMFVDEGFGSLSQSFLDLVMDELNDTAAVGHRLIGVISHVDEVKEGIQRRIEVEKSALGVSKAWIP